MSFEKKLLLLQGWYFLITGLWPLIHMKSFEALTGPKTDHWLVRCVGLLAGCTGAVLLLASRRGTIPAEVAALATLHALAFATIDIYYATRGRISRVYLVDGALQLVLAGAWVTAWRFNGFQ